MISEGSAGLTDGAVLPVVAGASAVALIFVQAESHAHAPVLTGQITAGVD